MLMSIIFKKLRPDKAMTLLKNQLININSNVVDAQKRLCQNLDIVQNLFLRNF